MSIDVSEEDAATLDQEIRRCLYTLEHQRHASPRWIARVRGRLLRLLYVRFRRAQEEA